MVKIYDKKLLEKDVNHKLPLKKDGSDMYEKMDDGILLCKVWMVMMRTMMMKMTMKMPRRWTMGSSFDVDGDVDYDT